MKYMPGANQLLPSRKFDDEVDTPLIVNLDGEDDGPRPYDEWTAEVAEGSNIDPSVLADAGEYHDDYDTLELEDSNVELVRVVGSSYATPTQIERFNDCDLFFFRHC